MCTPDSSHDIAAEWRSACTPTPSSFAVLAATATAMTVPAFVVFTDNTLIAIAEQLRADDAALVAIPGIGAPKLEQFGPDVLAMVRGRST